MHQNNLYQNGNVIESECNWIGSKNVLVSMFERIVRSSYLYVGAKVIEIRNMIRHNPSAYVSTYFMYKKCLEMSEIRFLEM